MRLMQILAALVFVSEIAFSQPAIPGKNEKKPPSIAAKIEAVKTRKDLLEQEMKALNKNRKCEGDGQCEVLEIGSRLCGGPSEFLIASTLNPKFASIKAKAAEFTSVEKELNMVDPPNECSPVPREPSGKCSEELCVPAYR